MILLRFSSNQPGSTSRILEYLTTLHMRTQNPLWEISKKQSGLPRPPCAIKSILKSSAHVLKKKRRQWYLRTGNTSQGMYRIWERQPKTKSQAITEPRKPVERVTHQGTEHYSESNRLFFHYFFCRGYPKWITPL